MEKHIDFSFSAPYYSLNNLTDSTTDIWIVCHGYGQLAKHFIRRFDVLDHEQNFVIALQGLSRFYDSEHKKVGASWMTKEDRETDMVNQRRYFDGVLTNALNGRSLEDFHINLLGFSQGVSMISRMAAYKKVNFNQLILWAGGFPPELTNHDFTYLNLESKLQVVLGDRDQYYKLDRYQKEVDRMQEVIGLEPNLTVFDGCHELKREVIAQLASDG